MEVLGAYAAGATWWLLGAMVVIFFIAWLIFRPQETLESPVTASQQDRPQAPQAVEDDLKVIEGIGPKLEQVLKEAGIKTYRDLAGKSAAELQAVLDAAGIARISNPQTWAEQAKLAAEGKWEELKALQDSLKGGVRQA